jgi:neutral ceramidase
MAMGRLAARSTFVATLMTFAILDGAGGAARADGWKAGIARAAITPKKPTWMAGYGARTRPSEGAVHDLWAKALVLEDPEGRKAALVTLDLCGIGRDVSVRVRDAIQARLGIGRDRVVLACSHTHCGPVVGSNLIGMYPLDDEQRQVVAEYTEGLTSAVVDTVDQAAGRLLPAELAWGNGQADFAVNRRENREAEVPDLRDRLALKGPVDHDVPVLRVRRVDGPVMAIVFGYACHCTTLSFYKFCGDYAGFAQVALEAGYPGAQAMFVSGCGADQNPLPRRSVELAEAYGNQLAESVKDVLRIPMHPISTRLSAAYEEIDLSFAELPTRDRIESDARSSDLATANRARMLLRTMETEGRLAPAYPYPIEVWKLGELTWIFLGGEVVVDYSLRLKRNLGTSHTWVSSYCNDVMAYIPSLRVLKEGGYEGDRSMIYYGRPTTWSDRVEDDIVAAIRRADHRIRSRE